MSIKWSKSQNQLTFWLILNIFDEIQPFPIDFDFILIKVECFDLIRTAFNQIHHSHLKSAPDLFEIFDWSLWWLSYFSKSKPKSIQSPQLSIYQ